MGVFCACILQRLFNKWMLFVWSGIQRLFIYEQRLTNETCTANESANVEVFVNVY